MKRLYVCFAIVLLLVKYAGAASFNWVEVGNAGNSADTTGFGAVDHVYRIATTEVTTAQYVEFLNAVAATDTNGLYDTNMSGSAYYNGITRTGSSANYTYSVNPGWEDKPVVYVSWYDTLRFANWLHNGQLSGPQDSTTTEYGAYDMSLGASVVRLPGARYWLPSEDEWYKAAYYSPGGVYYDYATGTDTTPNNNLPVNDTGNSVNYFDGGYTVGSPYYTTDVGSYTLSSSPYGTYDQSGNVWEWNEALISGERCNRGGSWFYDATRLSVFHRDKGDPSHGTSNIGFRIAGAIPEPLSFGLFLSSLMGLALRRLRII